MCQFRKKKLVDHNPAPARWGQNLGLLVRQRVLVALQRGSRLLQLLGFRTQSGQLTVLVCQRARLLIHQRVGLGHGRRASAQPLRELCRRR